MWRMWLIMMVWACAALGAGGDTLDYSDDVENFADGDTFYTARQWHPLKDSIQSIINGRLGNNNMADDAEIAESKIDSTSGWIYNHTKAFVTVKGDTQTVNVDTIKGNPYIDTVKMWHAKAPVSNGATLTLGAAAVTFNEDSVDVDFIVHGSNLGNVLTLRGSDGNAAFAKATPEAWPSNYVGVEFGGTAAVMAHRTEAAGNSLRLLQNVYNDGDWKRVVTDECGIYLQSAGYHAWFADASGTADAIFAPTERMRLTVDGKLGIGIAAPDSALTVIGSMRASGNMKAGGSFECTTINTGNGAFEIGQNLRTTDAIECATINTGNGAFEIGQNLRTTDAIQCATINTGLGAFEIGQNLRTTDDVVFDSVYASKVQCGDISMSGDLGLDSVDARVATLDSIKFGTGTFFSNYVEGSFPCTLTGVTATIVGTAHYVRIGNMITMQLPTLQGTSNSGGKTVAGIPAELRHSGGASWYIYGLGSGKDAGTDGWVEIQLTGSNYFLLTFEGGGWTNSGDFALYGAIVTYFIPW